MVNPRSGPSGNAPTPTIDAVRRRARHRLIGASVLVAVGVIGFPLLFDTQPRPIPVDIPIEIPARSTPSPAAKAPASAVAPAASAPTGGKLPMITEPAEAAPKAASAPATAAASAPASAPSPVPAPKAASAPPTATGTASAPASTPASAPSPAPAPPPAPAQAPAPTPAPAPAPARPAATEAARAEALLKGQPDPKAASPAATARLVVQVGAYADEGRVRDVRQKLEKAGLKTYVHTASTPEGKRTRVRVGPFDTRADADKAAARVKALGLPAAVLTL